LGAPAAPVRLQRILAGTGTVADIVEAEAVHAAIAVGVLIAQQRYQRRSVGNAPDAMGGKEPGQPGGLQHDRQHASSTRGTVSQGAARSGEPR